MKLRIALIALALSPLAAHAAEPAPLSDAWTGTGELGIAIAKGNTDSQTLVGKLGAKRRWGEWTVGAGADLLYASSHKVDSAHRYDVFVEGMRDLSPRSYVGANLRHDRDHFATNEYEWVAAGVYGYRFIANASTTLTGEAGPGYRWSKLQGVQMHNKEVIGRGALYFKHAINERTSFYDDLLVEAGKSNTYLSNDAGLVVKMSDALALKAGVLVRRNSKVIATRKHTDTLTTLNVVYGF